MMELARGAAGLLGFALLLLAPGAWLSFGLAARDTPVSVRLALAVVITPIVLFAEFYALAPLGVDFAAMPWLLAFGNAPALLLAWRRSPHPGSLDWRSAGCWAAVAVVPLACFCVPMLLWPEYRYFWSHSWMQSDMVYALASGLLRPEEPELAGVALSYPWAGHLQQALLSRALDSPPMASYVWTNLAFSWAIAALTAAMTRSLGGRLCAACASVVLLFFGVNAVGYWLGAAGEAFQLPNLFGDWRYTPWLWKFRFFNQMPMALGAFAGVAFLLSRRRAEGLAAAQLCLLGSLLLCLGIVYPLLLPVAYLLVLGFLLVAAPPRLDRLISSLRPWLAPACVLAVVGALSLAYALFVRADTQGGSPLQLADPLRVARMATTGVIATLLLLLGVLGVRSSIWPARSAQAAPLLIGGLGSLLLYAVLTIPYWSNEYKFVFTAALCLAPFAALWAEGLLLRFGRAWLPVLIASCAILALPFGFKTHEKWQGRVLRQPAIDVSSFDVQLRPEEALAAATDALRSRTPRDTVVIADAADIHLATLVQRAFYVPPAQASPHAGVGIVSLDILRFPRGHDPELLRRRALQRNALFHATDPKQRRFAIANLLRFGRPAAILLELDDHAALHAWLAGEPGARPIHQDAVYAVWLLDAQHGNEMRQPAGLAGATPDSGAAGR